MERPYSLCVLDRDGDGRPTFAAGSEAEGGPLMVFSPPGYEPRVIADQPGGFVCLCPFFVEARPAILAATQFFPGFNSAGARLCVYPLDGEAPFEIARAPYAHRIALCESGGQRCLLVSTLCTAKAFKEDWSQPGQVLMAPVPQDVRSAWALRPIVTGLTHNHGMDPARLSGERRDGYLLSADEGLFYLRVPDDPVQSWPVEKLAPGPHSDAVAHTGPDGQTLLFTISPFHGNQLAMYEPANGAWRRRVIADDLDFGHIVWAGELGRQSMLIAGGRGGRKELRLYAITDLLAGRKDYAILDEGVGAAQISVVNCAGDSATLIVTAHGAGEVRLYDLVT